MKCRVCGKEMKVYDTISDNVTEVTSFFLKPCYKKNIVLKLYKCIEEGCGHFQISNDLDEDYYDDYDIVYNPEQDLENLGYPKTLLLFYQSLLKDVISRYKIGDSLLDVGCGSGEILEIMSPYFKNCVGIEPSKKCCKLAKRKGLNVINDTFNNTVDFSDKYDCITCFMVLEHIEDLKGFIDSIYMNLADNGVAVINVPNGKKIIENAMYSDVFQEHLNYFTAESITKLFENNRFNIVSVETCYTDDLYLTAVAKKNITKCLLSEKKEDDKQCLNDIIKEFSNIGLFGIGIRARNIVNLICEKTK